MQNARRSTLNGKLRADAVFVDDDDLAGLDFADEFRVDEIERARLAGEHPRAFELAERRAGGSRTDRARR